VKRSLFVVIATVVVAIAAVTIGVAHGKASSRNKKDAVVAVVAPRNDALTQVVSGLAAKVRTETGAVPTEATVYTTTRGAAPDAVEATQIGYSPNDPIEIVLFKGDFAYAGHFGPPQADGIWHGVAISYVVDPVTEQANDFGFYGKVPDLSMLASPQVVPVNPSDIAVTTTSSPVAPTTPQA
jgi:hypothetical protein